MKNFRRNILKFRNGQYSRVIYLIRIYCESGIYQEAETERYRGLPATIVVAGGETSMPTEGCIIPNCEGEIIFQKQRKPSVRIPEYGAFPEL